MVTQKEFKEHKKNAIANLKGLTVYDMMLIENALSGDGSSHDVCDNTYDVVVCWDLPDKIDEDDEFHYDEAVTDIMRHVPLVKVNGDVWIADVCQFVRDHVDLVYDISQGFRYISMADKNLDKSYEEMKYEEDDSLYQGVQTIMALMPGNGTAEMYKKVIDYFRGKKNE